MNVSPHRQAILIFGIVLPLFMIGLVTALTLFGHAKAKSQFNQKVATLERYKDSERQVKELEAYMTVDDRREKVKFWTSKVEEDFVESLSSNLDKILAKYDSDVLRQTEMGQAQGASGIAAKTGHPHSRMQLSFEGGYKPMQMLLAELENEMPQLVLESLSIAPLSASSNRSKSALKFTVTYLSWENKAASRPKR